MTRMQKKHAESPRLYQQPFYLILLPVFFVLHGYTENFGFIEAGDTLLLGVWYIGVTVLIWAFSWLLFRNTAKAAFAAFITMSCFFFFGAFHDFLKEHSALHLFSHYNVLLPLFFIIIIGTIIYLKKKSRPFIRAAVLLNTLFLLYIAIDVWGLLWKLSNPVKNSLSVYSFAKDNMYKTCNNCAKPDIYFLLMDEYASSLSLRENFHFENDLDSFLVQNNFHIFTNSRSNYDVTPFSMASILNMSYLQNINNKGLKAEDYAKCNRLIRDNEVIKLVDANGYDVVNYSIFDLAGHPAIINQSFLPLKTKLITDRTLFNQIYKDIGWQLMQWYPFKFFAGNIFVQQKNNNAKLIELTQKSAIEKSSKPRFIYAHFYMPHTPYYFDRYGRARDAATVWKEAGEQPVNAYLEYVTYSNSQIKKVISLIRQKDPSAVIILMGDHGFRGEVLKKTPAELFRNMNAIYYPDKDYRLLHDSISAVNEFRIVFNKLFHQSLPMLKDSCIPL